MGGTFAVSVLVRTVRRLIRASAGWSTVFARLPVPRVHDALVEAVVLAGRLGDGFVAKGEEESAELLAPHGRPDESRPSELRALSRNTTDKPHGHRRIRQIRRRSRA